MFILNFSKLQNSRLILTTKFLILITRNGVLKFRTNIYTLYFYKQFMYLNLQNPNFKNLNFTQNYLIDFYNSIFNAIFPKTLHLNLQGIGYKFILQQNILKIRIGYSHFIDYLIPNDIFLVVPNPTNLIIYSNNKLILTKFTAFLKAQKKVNLYKGAGIFYQLESITLKKKNTNKNKNAK